MKACQPWSTLVKFDSKTFDDLSGKPPYGRTWDGLRWPWVPSSILWSPCPSISFISPRLSLMTFICSGIFFTSWVSSNRTRTRSMQRKIRNGCYYYSRSLAKWSSLKRRWNCTKLQVFFFSGIADLLPSIHAWAESDFWRKNFLGGKDVLDYRTYSLFHSLR